MLGLSRMSELHVKMRTFPAGTCLQEGGSLLSEPQSGGAGQEEEWPDVGVDSRCSLTIIVPAPKRPVNAWTSFRSFWQQLESSVTPASDLGAVVQVVVQLDLQVDLFHFGFLVAVDVDVSHRAVLTAEVLLHTLVHAHLHLSVEGILLASLLGVLPLG